MRWLCSPLQPPSESQPTCYLCSALASPAECHVTWPHKYTHRCRNTEGEACSAHIKNSYWRCQQGAQRSWCRLRGNLKEKCGTLLRLQPQRLSTGLGFAFLTLLKRGSTPWALALESIAKSRQMHQCRQWMLQHLGTLAEFLASWQDSIGVQHLPKCQSIIVNRREQQHAVSRQQVAYGFVNKTQPSWTEYPAGCSCGWRTPMSQWSACSGKREVIQEPYL